VRFADGRDAGRQLAMPLGEYRYEEPVVLGMVRTRLPAAAGLRER
jgi:predicted phosphoribosyltransferase